MKNPWDDIPSIWDGWNKQWFGAIADQLSNPVSRYDRSAWPEVHLCALGHVFYRHGFGDWDAVDSDVARRMRAIEDYITEHVVCTIGSEIMDIGPIGAANDLLRWTPDQFRDLDRRLEWEYQQAQLAKQIDEIQIESTDGQFDEIVPRGR